VSDVGETATEVKGAVAPEKVADISAAYDNKSALRSERGSRCGDGREEMKDV
jgi:hypothetical protein